MPSRLTDWLRSAFESTRCSRRPATARFRPGLEFLEDRVVPAGPVGGYSPQNVAGAYGIPGIALPPGQLPGTGQTIAVFEYAYNKYFASSTDANYDSDSNDLAVFSKQYNVPYKGPSIDGSGTVTIIGYNATNGTVYDSAHRSQNPAQGSMSSGGEYAADVEWVHSMAPGANLIVVEVNYDSGFTGATQQAQAMQFMASLPGVSVVTTSWYFNEDSGNFPSSSQEASLDQYFTTPTQTLDPQTGKVLSAGHDGVTFLACSDDEKGGYGAGWPATSANVVAVGGTDLTVDTTTNTWKSETAWSDSQGGFANYEPAPSPDYQADVRSLAQAQWYGSASLIGNRAVPDVAAISVADGNSSYALASYDTLQHSGWWIYSGTSVATPIWAGFVAIANQLRANAGLLPLNTPGQAQTLQRLYQLPSTDFHGITTVDNSTIGQFTTDSQWGGLAPGDPRLPPGFKSGDPLPLNPNYNLYTGLGSPIGNLLIPDLADIPMAPTTTGTTTILTSSANPASAGQAVTFTATVSAAGGGMPQGAVTFFVDGISQATVALVNGVATFMSTALTPGLHTIKAVYGGGFPFLGSTGQLSESVKGPGFPTTYSAIGTGSGGPGAVNVYDDLHGLLGSFDPLAGTGFTGGYRTAIGDLTGDGIPDLVVGTGAGGITLVLVYDGQAVLANPSNPRPLAVFQPYGPWFSAGVFVAIGKLDGRHAALVTGADAGGGPQVNIYSDAQLQSGQLATPAGQFFAYPFANGLFFTGGVRVAVGDVNGDGREDIITAAGPGGRPQVNIFLGMRSGLVAGLSTPFPTPYRSFYAFGSTLIGFAGGVYLTARDADGDGRADLFFGAGVGGLPEVAAFTGAQLSRAQPDLNPRTAFFALSPQAFTGGVRVGTALEINASGRLVPVLLAGAGPGGGPQVDEFDAASILAVPGATPTPLAVFNVPPAIFTGGLFPSVS